jgi:hypothetical protein
MSEDSGRKYRQRGYQDQPRERGPKGAPPAKEQTPRAPGRQLQDAAGPKTPNLMASHEVCRCARCGNLLSIPAGPVENDGRCSRCGVDLHSCVQCVSFDTSARFECSQTTLTARVSPKDVRNACALFTLRTTVERQTGTPGPTSARQAFDDLFK